MITVAVAAAVVLGLVGAATSWFLAIRTPMVVGLLLAVAAIGSAMAFRTPAPLREGIAVQVDGSCDSIPVGADVARRIGADIAPGIAGDAAVEVSFFADNARTNGRSVLDLTAPPPSGVRSDAVLYQNWKAPRESAANEALSTLRTAPCTRVGTSIVGAGEAAAATLAHAGVRGQRTIVLVTNLVEYSSTLKVDARTFAMRDVPAAVAAFKALPAPMRAPLGRKTALTILFTPAVRVRDTTLPLSEDTAIALETWARQVFRGVLQSGPVRVVVLPTGA